MGGGFVFVDSAYSWLDAADFDPGSGALVPLSRIEVPEAEPLGGHFLISKDNTAVFFRYQGDLWLEIESLRVRLTDEVRIDWEPLTERRAQLTIDAPGTGRLAWEYDTLGPDFEIDAEDGDFGLMIHNVLCEPERSAIIYDGSVD